MKRWLLFGLCCLLGNLRTQAADAFYINNGTITFPPQIDAVNFVNNGVFNISTVLPDPLFVTEPSPPFITANTRNFTNNGSLFGTPGWQFDNGPTAEGPRVWADSFVNRGDGQNNGVVQGFDSPGFIIIGGPNIAPVQPNGIPSLN